MEIIADFPNLLELSLQVQNVPRIVGLDELLQLQRGLASLKPGGRSEERLQA